MSVTGISYTKRECFTIIDRIEDNSKLPNNNKNVANDVCKIKDKFLTSKMNTKSIVTILVAIILAISCTVALLTFLYLTKGKTKYCHSTSCTRSAETLLASMNLTVDPCDDFYEFACGRWFENFAGPNYSSSSDWFENQQDLLLRNISKYLMQNNSIDEPLPVHQARTFFKSCMLAEQNLDNNVKSIEDTLAEVNLPTLPPLNESSANFSWTETAVRSKRVFNQDFFINFNVASDPENRTVNILHIGKPSGLSPLPVHRYTERILISKFREALSRNEDDTEYSQEEDSSVVLEDSEEFKAVYLEYVTNVTKIVFEAAGAEWSPEIENEFNESVHTLFEFKATVDDLIDRYFNNGSQVPQLISVVELQEMTDNISEELGAQPIIDWRQYFSAMFANTENVTLDFDGTDSIVALSDIGYIETIIHYLIETPPSVIEFYMWWKVVATIGPYTHKRIYELNREFNYAFTERAKRPREIYCAEAVNEMMGMATAYSVVNNTEIRENMKKISMMVDNIKRTFLKNIENLKWMDDETKITSIKKIKTMKQYIGFPTWLTNKEELEAYYDNVNVDENNFLENVLDRLQKSFKEMLENFRKLNDFDEEMWVSDPMDVNAYNFIEGNTITIPAGILQFPFYGQGLEALNYGAIGSIIGHEVTHSFDNTGKEYDDSGNTNQWWTPETTTEFKKRAECFVKDYETFTFPQNSDMKVNGMRTLDENIADNGGLHTALFAYRNYVQNYGVEPLLPNLKQYTPEQLFFLGFSTTWCEKYSSESLHDILNDEHSPNRIRVWGTLSNSREFAQVWKCKEGTKMNPSKDKCRMW